MTLSMRNLLLASAACLALVGCQQGSDIISPGLTVVDPGTVSYTHLTLPTTPYV